MTASREKWSSKFSEWFDWVLQTGEFYDYGRYPVKGMGVWLPYGFQLRKRIIELIRGILDKRGHEEILLPLLIPEHLLAKEKEHIKGFEGEVYWVTRGGTEDLDVKLALRPTSETSISLMESYWIKSYRQLPKKYYQVVSIFRYETKATRAMIRLREVTTFKEAHTVHASFEDAERQVFEAVECYKEFFDRLGIPYVISKRPDWDKFAGALYTIAFDTVFPDGRILQIGTAHHLGQGFAIALEVRIQLSDGSMDYAWQTSYGISDRVVASIISIHGDDRGAVLPPNIAPIQVVIVPIPGSSEDVDKQIRSYIRGLEKELVSNGIRTRVDWRTDVTPGYKFYDWELRGAPLRMEIGAREVEKHTVTIARRDTLKRIEVKREEVFKEVGRLLEEITENISRRAWEWLKNNIRRATSVEEAKEIISTKRGIVEIPWCGREACGLTIEEKTEAKALGTPLERPRLVDSDKCPICGRKAVTLLRIAKTY